MTSVRRGLSSGCGILCLAVWLALVLAATLFPYNFEAVPTGSEVLTMEVYGFRQLIDVGSNILLFVPFGALLAALLRPRGCGLGRTCFLAGFSALLISGTIEILQQSLPSREASLLDLLCNALGAVAGSCACWKWGAIIASWSRRFRRGAPPAVRAGVLAGCCAGLLLLSAVIQYRSRPTNWDDEFVLLIGNEDTGDRPWLGTVYRVDMSDAALSEQVLRAFAAGEEAELPAGSIAGYEFKDGARFNDRAGRLPPLVWTGPENLSTPPGLKLTEDSWLRSSQPPREFARRVRNNGEFSLRVVCASDNAVQAGPARVLSYSVDLMNRNFTLGQEGPDLVFRLRTPNGGPNGTRFPLFVPGVFATSETRDILVSYGGAALRVAVAGSNQVHSVEFSPGPGLAIAYLPLEPQHFGPLKVIYLGGVFLLLIGMLVWLMPGLISSFVSSLTLLLSFSFLLEVVLAVAAGRSFDWSSLGVTAIVGFTALGAVTVPVRYGGAFKVFEPILRASRLG